MVSICVLGLPKSGTTVIYSSIKNKLPLPTCSFEPKYSYQIDFLKNSTMPFKLCKILYPFTKIKVSDLRFFEKKILLVRDPRDRLVSFLLYKLLIGRRYEDNQLLEKFLDKLKLKESNPQSVSVIDLIKTLGETGNNLLDKSLLNNLNYSYLLMQNFPDMLIFKYESFVDQQLEQLNQYIGINLSNKTKLQSNLSFNERKKGYGGWKNWFTQKDVDYFKPLMKDYINKFDYDSNWELNPLPKIESTFSSEYLKNQSARLIKYPAYYGKLKSIGTYTREYIQQLEEAVSDGLESAMIEMALIYLAGYGVEKCLDKYHRFILLACERGLPMALAHLGVAFIKGIGVSKSIEKARMLFFELQKKIGNKRAKNMIDQINLLYSSL